MKPAHLRRWGAAATAAVAAGLLAAPAAAADTGLRVTATTASPQPRTVSTGAVTDACDSTTTPGWIGRTVDGPFLDATVAADTATGLSARFAVWDATTGADTAVFSGIAQAVSGQARIKAAGLADGHSYTWQARALQGHKISPASADCHFRVDNTSATVAVTSTDFPALGSGQKPNKYAGETATFTLTGTDPVPAGGEASGIACYRYALNDHSAVYGGCAGPTVQPGPDGSAALALKVPEWGSNTLYVEAVDNAGNISQAFAYNFYAPSDPRPKAGVPGDVDGDAVPDILLPDAAGNLQVISGRANSTAPTSLIPAALSRGGWNGTRVIHKGWGPHAPADDLLMRNPAAPGSLYAYTNSGAGDFGSDFPSLVGHPDETGCVDAALAEVPCPEGFRADWQDAEQLVALGNDTPNRWPVLLSVEHGDLWAYYPGLNSYRTVQRLTTSGAWTGYDLVAGIGTSGTFHLWARERANGVLHAYPVPKQPGTPFDFSALADPSSGVVATGFTVDAYPTLGSSGDLDGDGEPDLWAVTADRHLLTYRGFTTPKDLGVLR
ncbi:hypothetical protein ACF9IK_22000 [Kitasatospora hibisci]|uniref:hypothetical protein n=1 Tax=Kitasatospora hibisci TaxID=3369522 RepID=UPI003754AE9B